MAERYERCDDIGITRPRVGLSTRPDSPNPMETRSPQGVGVRLDLHLSPRFAVDGPPRGRERHVYRDPIPGPSQSIAGSTSERFSTNRLTGPRLQRAEPLGA